MSHRDETGSDTTGDSSEETELGDEPTEELVDRASDLATPSSQPPEADDSGAQSRGGDPWVSTQDIDPGEVESMFEERSEFPSLIVISGARAGETRRLESERTVLGRKRDDVDLWFRDTSVSRTHAEIIRGDDGEVLLRDMESSNGTYVNGRRLGAPLELAEGDKVTLGNSVLLKFTWQDEIDEEFQRRMYNSSVRDELTGAHSRSYLLEQMRSEIAYAERHGADLSLVFLDIDRFKRVNDAYGHLAGDRVLVQLAELVRTEIRQEDLFARYGGEEFAIMVRDIDLADVEEMAERIRRHVETEPFGEEGDRFSVTISAGVVPYDGTAMDDADDWIQAADEAMYLAKEAGRNCVRLHRSGLDFDGGIHDTVQ